MRFIRRRNFGHQRCSFAAGAAGMFFSSERVTGMARFVLRYDSRDPQRSYDAAELESRYSETSQWGLSAHIDLGACDAGRIRDKPTIHEFTVALCDLINMKRFPPDEPPLIIRFGENPVVTGYSMVQLIETSDITAHFAEDENGVYLDIFSCKYYDPLTAAEFAAKFFSASSGFTFVALFRKAPS